MKKAVRARSLTIGLCARGAYSEKPDDQSALDIKVRNFHWNVLSRGAPGSELPKRYGSPTTCWRRLKEWETSEVLLRLWGAFLNELNDRQKLRWNECCIDGNFVPAKKGGRKSRKPSGARVNRGTDHLGG